MQQCCCKLVCILAARYGWLQPQLAVEAGTMAGYSAIKIAQVSSAASTCA
jgi:predicted O-methyltransferase YrrM